MRIGILSKVFYILLYRGLWYQNPYITRILFFIAIPLTLESDFWWSFGTVNLYRFLFKRRSWYTIKNKIGGCHRWRKIIIFYHWSFTVILKESTNSVCGKRNIIIHKILCYFQLKSVEEKKQFHLKSFWIEIRHHRRVSGVIFFYA